MDPYGDPMGILRISYVLRPAAAGVAKLAARDSQLRVQMLLF